MALLFLLPASSRFRSPLLSFRFSFAVFGSVQAELPTLLLFTHLVEAGLKKPLGTGPVTAVTGLTGPDRFRFRPVQTGPKFKF